MRRSIIPDEGPLGEAIYLGLVSAIRLSVGLLKQKIAYHAYAFEMELRETREASTTMLSMFADGTFWMAADADTILDSDGRLDYLLGKGDRLSEIIGERFKPHPTDSSGTPPAVNMKVSLKNSRADMLVVDRRLVFPRSTRTEAYSSQPGYFVAVRLADPIDVQPISSDG